MKLNEKARQLVERMLEQADELRIINHDDGVNVPVIDVGVEARGGIDAGIALAEIASAGLITVNLLPGVGHIYPGPEVVVRTDHPVAACLASQYAGWKIDGENFLSMGSGPMRAAAAKEELFGKIDGKEETSVAVGVLEAGKLPPVEVCKQVADDCQVDYRKLTLLVARTASIAGTLQVVARSVETAMHKLHEVGFDLSQVVSAFGAAPLPPVAADDLAAMGRTNDAIIYGSRIQLWVDCEDDAINEVIKKVPSNSSTAHGQKFIDLFNQAGGDFYKMDPMLFSPAWVRMTNLKSGRTFEAGAVMPDVLKLSFKGW